MNIILVHGMGRTSFSWILSAKKFKNNGHTVFTFNYSSSKEDIESISCALAGFIQKVQSLGEYILIGHSLGGVLLRIALEKLEGKVRLPNKLYLIGSPIKASLMAKKLKNNKLFSLMTGDCGQLLASESRMKNIAIPNVPIIAITGVKGLVGRFSPFGTKINDTVVTEDETHIDWMAEDSHCKQYRVPVRHTFMPSNKIIARIVLNNMSC